VTVLPLRIDAPPEVPIVTMRAPKVRSSGPELNEASTVAVGRC
jgi:hypothetical protein